MFEEAVNKLADAIAYAEGFYVAGSRPARNHNPGNLTKDLTGKAIGKDSIYVVYANNADGWEALKKQVSAMLDNSSRIYNSAMSIMDMARKYTTTEQEAWAKNVASRLGVSTDTKLMDLVGVGIGIGVIAVFVFLWWMYKQKGN